MNKKNILVVAAHPDDEVLGCGGSIARWSDEGHDVNIIILAEGLTSRDLKRNRELKKGELDKLSIAANKSAKILGAKSITLYDFPDNRMDSVDLIDIVKIIEKSIKNFSPEIIVTHHESDLNIDHRKVFSAVITATRPYPGQSVKEILTFEVQSATEWQSQNSANSFNPNYYLNISNTLEIKLKALNQYKSEMRKYPHSRSLEAIEFLAKWRGSNVGVEAAECFKIIRKID